MWRRIFVFTLCLVEIFSMYSVGVQVTIIEDTIRFHCEVDKYYRKLKPPVQGTIKNISSIQFVYCLDDTGEQSDFPFPEQHFSTFSALKSIAIISNKLDLHRKKVWHNFTLDSFNTLKLQYDSVINHFFRENGDCETLFDSLQLNEFRSLKRLELIIRKVDKRCSYGEKGNSERDFDFRKLTGLEHLRFLIYKGFDGIGLKYEDILLENQQNLIHLDLSENYIKKLPNEALQNKSQLKTLILAFNMFTHVPEFINDLQNLEYLDLSHNSLTIFEDLELMSLKVLKVCNNKFLRFQNLFFPNLNTLDGGSLKIDEMISQVSFLENNLLEDFKEPVLDIKNVERLNVVIESSTKKIILNNLNDLPKLKYLQIHLEGASTYLNTLNHIFELQNLKELSLKGWIGLSPNALNNFKYMSNLTISNCRFNQIVTNTSFEGLRRLENLDLSYTKIHSIKDNLYHKCQNLRSIKMTFCSLGSIHVDAFHSLGLLEELHLGNNRLKTLPNGIFRSLQNLKSLRLESNQISLLPDLIFQNLKNILSLDFERNLLPVFDDKNCEFFPKLQNLTLSYNKISKFDFANCIEHLNSTKSDSFRTIDLDFRSNSFDFIDLEASYRITQKVENMYINLNLQDISTNCDCRMFKSRLTARALQGEYSESRFNWTCLNLSADIISTTDEQLKCRTLEDGVDCKYFYQSDGVQVVNCSSLMIEVIPKLPLLGENCTSIELNIESNQLVDLSTTSDNTFYQNVTKILAARNKIVQLSKNHLPKGLNYLDIRANNFTSLNQILFGVFKAMGMAVHLSENAFVCTCEDKDTLGSLRLDFETILDYDKVECIIDGITYPLRSITETTLCGPDLTNLHWILTGLTLLLLVMAALVLFYKYNHEIKVWLFAHNLLLCWVSEEELDMDRIYDAFVSFSWQDERYVEEMIDNLENCDNPYRLCLHFRDWRIGEYISNQIITSVNQSKRTIIILTKSFVESIWAKLEFRVAAAAALKEKRSRVIIILCEPLEIIGEVDEELQAYLNTNTYIKWDDPRFWDRLRYALPHRRAGLHQEVENGIELRQI